MKIFNKNFGFTLVEMMVAVGVSSLVILAVINAQKNSINSQGRFKVDSEINNIIQTITVNLGKGDTCLKNFNGKPVTQAAIAALFVPNKISANAKYGEEVMVNVISTVPGAANVMLLTVNYTPRNKTASQFTIPIDISVSGGLINSCHSNLEIALQDAVKFACQGTGAQWIAGGGASIGSCEHIAVMKDFGGAIVAPNAVTGDIFCPTGQYLKQIDVSDPGNLKAWTFRCSTVTSGGGLPCLNWQYLRGINADGSNNCVDIRTFFAAGAGIVVLQSGVYKSVPALTCPANQILQSISAAGTANCVDPSVQPNCAVNQYVKGIDAVTGVVQCAYSINSDVCAVGTYMNAVDVLGNVICVSGALPSSCASNQVMTGITAAGVAICAAMP